MCFNAIHEKKILAKISESTVSVRAVKINTDSSLISLFTENDMMSLLKSQQ